MGEILVSGSDLSCVAIAGRVPAIQRRRDHAWTTGTSPVVTALKGPRP